MGLSRQAARGSVQVSVSILLLEDLLHEVGCGSAGNVFVDHKQSVGALEGRHTVRVEVKRKQGLHVNHLDGDSEALEFRRGVHHDAQRGSVRHDGGVGSGTKNFRAAQGYREAPQVGGQVLFESVSVEALDDHGGLVGLQQGSVHSGGLDHVARGAEVHSAKRAQQQLHGGSAVPHALEAVPAGTYDERSLLASGRTPANGGAVV